MERIGKIILAVLILAFAQTAFAQQNRQTYSISGKVIDAKTGEAVIGAAVNVEDTGIWAISDEKGAFTLTEIKPGSYSVVFSCLGCGCLICPGIHSEGYIPGCQSLTGIDSHHSAVQVSIFS